MDNGIARSRNKEHLLNKVQKLHDQKIKNIYLNK